jgi:hypothetical protein
MNETIPKESLDALLAEEPKLPQPVEPVKPVEQPAKSPAHCPEVTIGENSREESRDALLEDPLEPVDQLVESPAYYLVATANEFDHEQQERNSGENAASQTCDGSLAHRFHPGAKANTRKVRASVR